MRHDAVSSNLLSSCVLLLVSLLATPVLAHQPKDAKLAPPEVALRLIAPSAEGAWLLRIDNEGERPVRLAADIRLLTLEVRAPSASKSRWRRTRGGWDRRAVTCNGPKIFGLTQRFPARRELILEPGQSYVEQFDPRLLCFGKDAAGLVPGARVKATFGWPDNARRGLSSAPFVVDDARSPRENRPLRHLSAPTIVLSHGPPVTWGPRVRGRGGKEGAGPSSKGEPAAGKPSEGTANDDPGGGTSATEASRYEPQRPAAVRPPPPKDELAAALTLTADRWADGRRPTDIALSVQAHNVGDRPVFVALRSRMLSFRIYGPDGLVKCPRATKGHEVPRDLFRTLNHDKHIHMDVMLAEVCPANTFDRPGLYWAVPTLHAEADGKEYGLSAATGEVTVRDAGTPGGSHQAGDDATLVRITRGRAPFYGSKPAAVPTRVIPE